MRSSKLALSAALAAAGVALSGCAYGAYGDPYGYGTRGGVSIGYGYGYGGDPYCNSYYGSRYGGYGGYGSYYGSRYSRCGGMPYYGWYDGFYYPGSGFYVYDRYRTRYRWTDAQRKYWEWRRKGSPAATGKIGRTLENWADFQNQPQTSSSVRTQQVAPSGTYRTRGERMRSQRMRDGDSSVSTRSTIRTRSTDSVGSRNERSQRRERNRPED